MVTNLVGNHIGLRELAGLAPDVARTEAPLEILKETSVEIDFLIDRAVERPIAAFAKPQPDCVAPENMTNVGGL
jgi:hypothetical protein